MPVIMIPPVKGRKHKISAMAAYRDQFLKLVMQGSATNSLQDKAHAALEKHLTNYEIGIIQWEVVTQTMVKYTNNFVPVALNLYYKTKMVFETGSEESSDVQVLCSRFWTITQDFLENVTTKLVTNMESILRTTICTNLQHLLRIFSAISAHLDEPCPSNLRIHKHKSQVKMFVQQCKERIMGQLREEVQKWFQLELGKWKCEESGDTTECMMNLMADLTSLLRIRKSYLIIVFKSLGISVFDVTFSVWSEQIFDMIRMRLEPIQSCDTQLHEENSQAEISYKLYKTLTKFLRLNETPSKFSGCWQVTRLFLPWILRWTEVIRVRNLARIENAVGLDNFEPVSTTSLVSSSAVDVAELLLKSNEFWDELAWPVPEEAYCILILVIKNVFDFAFQYIDNLTSKLNGHELGKSESNLAKECIALNNIEQIVLHVDTVLQGFQIRTLLATISIQDGQHVQLRQYALVLPTLVKYLQDKLKKTLKKSVRFAKITHVVMIFNNLENYQCCLELLVNYISSLKSKLSSTMLSKVLTMIWKRIVKAFEAHVRVCIKTRQNSINYFQRLQFLLFQIERLIYDTPSLTESSCVLRTANLRTTLRLHGNSTRDLQLEYLTIRFCEQWQGSKARKNGVSYDRVTIRAEYFRKSQLLKLEILNAAFNENIHHSYVKMQLVLRSTAKESPYLYTQVKNTNYAMFETVFSVHISNEDWSSGGIIRFWVKTRACPVLQPKGRIIGEAFLPLEAVFINNSVAQCGFTQSHLKLPLTKGGDYNPSSKLKLLDVLSTREEKLAINFVRRERRELTAHD